MEDFLITMAAEEQAEEIMGIYRSLIGVPGCSWNEAYPSIEDVRTDIRNQSLYIVRSHEKMIAAAAAGKEDPGDCLACWSREMTNPCILARVGVLQEYQQKGIAQTLLRQIERDAVTRGFDGIHLLVSKTNPPALALYQRLGYHCCGEIQRYDIDWFCYEKSLRPDTAGE